MSVPRFAAALAALVLVGVALWRRGRLGFERLAVAVVAAIALAVYATGLPAQLPDPERVIERIATTLGPWTYVLVGLMAFLETGAFIGFVAPGEFTVILGGVIAGQGEIAIVPLIGLVWLCTVLGDTVSFFIGRHLGRAFLWRYGPRIKVTHERLEQVEQYFERHGGATVLIGRFIGIVRPIAPFIAGSSRMRYRQFLPYSVVGTGLWATTFCMVGYLFYRSFSKVTKIAGRATLGFALLVGTIALGVYGYRRLRRPEERRRLAVWAERQGRRPLLRPLAALLRVVWRRAIGPAWSFGAPRLRFLGGRLTPGNLGIEFTTALALAGVGLYVFGVYAAILARDPGALPEDSRTMGIVRGARIETVVDVLEVVTNLGSFPVVCGLVLVAAIVLAFRRRPVELTTLVLGFVATVAAVQIAKAGIARPRPTTAIIDADGGGFPSGHAAYSTAYVALAIIAARVVPGLIRRAALVLSAVVVAAAIGISRIYLQVHYWSDVAAGWGLGFGIFGACAAVALVVTHLRQPDSPPEAGAGVPATDSDSG